MPVVFLIVSVGLQVWAWRSLIPRVRAGALTRMAGATRYASWAFLPLMLFVGTYLAMVGVEEWLHVALLEERTALLALPMLGLSTLGSAGFAVRCAFLRT